MARLGGATRKTSEDLWEESGAFETLLDDLEGFGEMEGVSLVPFSGFYSQVEQECCMQRKN